MKRKRILIVIAIVALATVAYLLYRSTRQTDSTTALRASGTVEATDAQLGFQATGRIAEIRVHEGDEVAAGAEIALLDRTEMSARREQVEAQIDGAQAQLRDLELGSRREEIAGARAAAAAARDRLADARRDAERTRTLFAGGAVPKENLDKAELAVDVAQSQLTQADEGLRLLEAGPRRERIDAQRAQLAQAEASLKAIDATLANMVVSAPFAGVVTVRHREPGEVVSGGSPVVTLLNPADRWVRIYVPEDRIAALHLGAPATITCDTYPGKRYPGEVTFIASEAEFTPKNVQTTEERVRLVYAVKVRVTGDPGVELKPGLPADVELEAPGSGR
jgi:HlyD family secretion protein